MIYFDNAATSWPKPDAVIAAVQEHFHHAGGNPGRSGHRMSIAAARVVEQGRQALADLFNVRDPSRIVFTQNATHALNLAIYGLLRPGDRVVTTNLEHNSVMRPLRHLETLGVTVTVVESRADGALDMDDLHRALRGARLLVTTHASNVFGTLMPVKALSAAARARGALYLVDAAQTAGVIPIDIEELEVDLLAFSGHKGLLGPTGTGALYVRDGIALAPLMRGGTGSDSAHETQPEFLPDALESGTMNVAGIAGLASGVHFLSERGIAAVQAHEQALVAQFIVAASQISGVTLYGERDSTRRCGVVSFTVAGATSSDVGLVLDESFGIMARTGLHCAPSAHRTFGTFPGGTVRFSFGWFNTPAEVETSMRALREIASWAGASSLDRKAVRTWTA